MRTIRSLPYGGSPWQRPPWTETPPGQRPPLTETETPPPAPRGQTKPSENITFPQLLLRAVKMQKNENGRLPVSSDIVLF